REYYFVSEAVFEQRVQEDEFLEYVDLPWGARSGTLRSEIDRIKANGKVPLLDLETDGAIRVKETIPGAVTVFVDAPTFAELERRLRDRATESSEKIQVRLDLARRQQEQRNRFDYVIVNDDVERAADQLQAIVEKELQTAGTMSRPCSLHASMRSWTTSTRATRWGSSRPSGPGRSTTIATSSVRGSGSSRRLRRSS